MVAGAVLRVAVLAIVTLGDREFDFRLRCAGFESVFDLPGAALDTVLDFPEGALDSLLCLSRVLPDVLAAGTTLGVAGLPHSIPLTRRISFLRGHGHRDFREKDHGRKP